jgi:hypothetical protein
MVEENCVSPFFGILVLKRLSSLSARLLPLSRETFNAQEQAVVKCNFWMILAGCARHRPGNQQRRLEIPDKTEFSGVVLSWHRFHGCAS